MLVAKNQPLFNLNKVSQTEIEWTLYFCVSTLFGKTKWLFAMEKKASGEWLSDWVCQVVFWLKKVVSEAIFLDSATGN